MNKPDRELRPTMRRAVLLAALSSLPACSAPAPIGDADLGAPIIDAAIPIDLHRCDFCGTGCAGGMACSAGLVCDAVANACVECTTDAHCGAGRVCRSHLCAAGCSASQACGDAGICSLDAGVCLECILDGDCADPTRPRCSPTSNRCVPCLPAQDNCGPGLYCPMGSGEACASGCKGDRDCQLQLSDAGVPSMPFCRLDVHACAACLLDGDCPIGSTCQGDRCAPGCNAMHGCPVDRACCGGACVDEKTDTSNCGGCGAACNNGASCCRSSCAALASDPRNCGACGLACVVANGAPACAAGTCLIASCSQGFVDCNHTYADGCEAFTDGDPGNCGKCGAVCVVPHATAACSAGVCLPAACNMGFLDCNHVPADGCEVDVRSDPLNCGQCNGPCAALPHATAGCINAACKVGVCDAGYGNCDKIDANGCEALFDSDPANCGGCGMACPTPNNTSATCAQRVCGLGACKVGYGDCDKNAGNGCEANLATDPGNCGACGVACAMGSICVMSMCTAAYGSGADGALTVAANTVFAGYAETHLSAGAVAGDTSISVVSANGFAVGAKLLVMNVRSGIGNDGAWEVADVSSVKGSVLGLGAGLVNAYPEAANTLVRSLPQYTSVTINAGTTLSCTAWDGVAESGGIIAFYASTGVTVTGTISTVGLGYAGGIGDSKDPGANQFKQQGESYLGLGTAGNVQNSANAGGGNGGVKRGGCEGSGGGGGGYAATGTSGGDNLVNCGGSLPGGVGGSSYGDVNLNRIYLGSGGGAGGYTTDPAQGAGGKGGGIVIIISPTVTLTGTVDASGGDGTDEFKDYGGGGGGAGGSIYLRTQQPVVNSMNALVSGGSGGKAANARNEAGGAGSSGRLRLDVRP